MIAYAKDSPVTTRETTRSLPQPTTRMDRRIVTLLDWMGTLQLSDIADDLGERGTAVWDRLKALQALGYVTPSSEAGGWISTHAWRPDARNTEPGVHDPDFGKWKSGVDELNP